MRYLIIEHDIVTNCVIAEADFAASQGWVLAPEGVGIDWTYDGEAFTPPPDPIPPTIEETRAQMRELSRMEFKLMLRGLGHDEQQVASAFAAIADPELRYLVDLAWREAGFFRRDDPLIDPAGAVLGLPPENIDAAWQAYAANLPPISSQRI